ncbi:uncharacterized protein LOC122316144 [Carya illinoinensis]|uniref:uncharacterized protein LOC122316144 n=1 Tax=Carya illinoinensis TaxID=32201 RepID=UPI001C71E035|nr:uncharacterized protein LOC122316144 [Carya illinoinensis]
MVLRRAWGNNGSLNQTVIGLLNNSRMAFQIWSKMKKQRNGKEVEEKTKLLQRLQAEESNENVEEIRKITTELHSLLENEDLWWKQRAKTDWYKHGDRNTKYFNACANQRRKRNFIKEVEDESNNMACGYIQVEEIFRKYFGNVFQSTQPSKVEIESCLVGMDRRVTERMNERLSRRFTAIEVEQAVKQMAPLKAPSPDGFGPCFYQNHWGIVSEEVIKAALAILNGSPLDHNLNYTYLALIPKTKSPRKVTEYRPISLCNVLYKIVSKTITNRTKIEEWRRIQGASQVYEKASGQFLNKEKTAVFFSRNSYQAIKEVGQNFVCGTYEKYLGLPAIVGRSKFNTFRSLKERILQKIVSWENKFLSQVGKEVLIKAVLQSIPTYTMGVFKLPSRLCKDINGMFSKFWWGKQQEGREMIWRKWERLSVQIGKWGMGFRDLESFNTALLAKQGWRILKYPLNLVAIIFREKYFKKESFMEAKLGSQPFLIWRIIWSARNLLKEGLRWRVGDEIWGSKWVPSPISYAVQSPVKLLKEDAKVEELINLRERNQGESSAEERKDDRWNRIWELKVPGVTKLFICGELQIICYPQKKTCIRGR